LHYGAWGRTRFVWWGALSLCSMKDHGNGLEGQGFYGA
jgi:hypothetical protein